MAKIPLKFLYPHGNLDHIGNLINDVNTPAVVPIVVNMSVVTATVRLFYAEQKQDTLLLPITGRF